MQQLENDVLCKYCLGCNKLEDLNFKGTRNCKEFVQAQANWRILYDRAIKENLNTFQK